MYSQIKPNGFAADFWEQRVSITIYQYHYKVTKDQGLDGAFWEILKLILSCLIRIAISAHVNPLN